jgi:hypothetical protein
MSLFEAAARFHALDVEMPPFPANRLSDRFAGGAHDERQCRRVIANVYNLLQPDQCWPEGVVARLEVELEEHLRRHGTVRLP